MHKSLSVIEAEISKAKIEEYKDEIINHMASMEAETKPDSGMIDLQPEIEWHMRPYLLDFLIDTHHSLNLQPESLFLTINLIDRYCSKRIVFRKHYQLVACSALWIASKYEDKKTRVPAIHELKSMCCDTYEEDMFTQMERHVLNTLDWSIGHPTVESFLKLCIEESPAEAASDPLVTHVARFLCELAQFHRCFMSFEGSTLASAAHSLALHITGYSIQLPSSMSTNQNQYQCISMLAEYMQSPTRSLQKKYSRASFSHAYYTISNFVSRHQASASDPLPPTPPPRAVSSQFTPPSSASSASSPSIFTPVDSPVGIPPKGRADIYLTPPRTPAEYGIIPQPVVSGRTAVAGRHY